MSQSINVTVSTFGTVSGGYRTFKSGSRGWYVNGKVNVPVGESLPTLTIAVDGKHLEAKPRQFSTGSWGWYANGKVETPEGQAQVGINIIITNSKGLATPPANTLCKVQVGGNITILGSKPGSVPSPKATKKPTPVAAQTIVPTVQAVPAMSQDDMLKALLAKLFTQN